MQDSDKLILNELLSNDLLHNRVKFQKHSIFETLASSKNVMYVVNIVYDIYCSNVSFSNNVSFTSL